MQGCPPIGVGGVELTALFQEEFHQFDIPVPGGKVQGETATGEPLRNGSTALQQEANDLRMVLMKGLFLWEEPLIVGLIWILTPAEKVGHAVSIPERGLIVQLTDVQIVHRPPTKPEGKQEKRCADHGDVE